MVAPTTGIWQTVWLEALPERCVSSLQLWPNLEGGALGFDVLTEGHAEVVASLDGTAVGAWSGPAGRGRFVLGEVVSWRPGSPRLYGS